jgi:hypothetical protein
MVIHVICVLLFIRFARLRIYNILCTVLQVNLVLQFQVLQIFISDGNQ